VLGALDGELRQLAGA
jgi:hypothetical protein